MAYKRNYKKKGFGRRFGRRYGGRKMGNRKTYGRSVKSRAVLTNIVDTVVRRTSELKSHNFTNIIPFPVAGATYGNVLTLVPQGSTSITRTGDRFRMTSLTLNVSMYEPATTVTAATSGYMRCIVYQWKPSIGTLVTLDQILGGVAEYDSSYNMENRQMYKVLLDKTVPLVALTDNSRHAFTQTLYFRGAEANVQCQAGVVTGTNHVGILFVPSHAGASCTALARIDTLLRFTDN